MQYDKPTIRLSISKDSLEKAQ
uniref:Uncharacterized protein n=1 Tax=Rhizophora mucronata TaxID=61149 RepID=A0A2P2R5A9_RHIMU